MKPAARTKRSEEFRLSVSENAERVTKRHNPSHDLLKNIILIQLYLCVDKCNLMNSVVSFIYFFISIQNFIHIFSDHIFFIKADFPDNRSNDFLS